MLLFCILNNLYKNIKITNVNKKKDSKEMKKYN